jgi:hypothetical protein
MAPRISIASLGLCGHENPANRLPWQEKLYRSLTRSCELWQMLRMIHAITAKLQELLEMAWHVKGRLLEVPPSRFPSYFDLSCQLSFYGHDHAVEPMLHTSSA